MSVLHLSGPRRGRRPGRIKGTKTENYPARGSCRECLGEHSPSIMGRGKLILRLSGFHNRHSYVGRNTRSPSAPVTTMLPPCWDYECSASPGSSVGACIACTAYRKIAGAGSVCLEVNQPLPVAVRGTEAPT